MRFLLPLTLMAIMGLAPPPQDPWQSIPRIRQGQSLCAGFVVSPTQILTAKHCIKAEGGDILVDDVPTYKLKENDAFVLLAMPPNARPALILGANPKQGDDVISYGYGYGFVLAFKRSVAGWGDGHPVMDGPLVGGMSGGPVLDASGKVVGINQASSPELSIMCSVEEIREFLK